MDENIKKVDLEAMLPLIVEKLQSGGEVVIPITGTSMLPLLKAGKDYAVLAKAPEKLNKYDIPFYRRDDGHFVLHRIVGEDENGYILCGDNQSVKEYGVKHSQIIGVLKYIERNGKRLSVENPKLKPNALFRDEILFARGILGSIKRRINGKGKN